MKQLNSTETAHTHLQQPDVAWSQSWESVKHVRALDDGLLLNQWWMKGQKTSSSSWTPRRRNLQTDGLSPFSAWTLQPVLSYVMQDSPVSPNNISLLSLHNRLQAACLRGLQELAHGNKEDRLNRGKDDWSEGLGHAYISITPIWCLIVL